MNFNVNFNVLLSKYIVHQLVKRDFDNIKMHDTTTKRRKLFESLSSARVYLLLFIYLY